MKTTEFSANASIRIVISIIVLCWLTNGCRGPRTDKRAQFHFLSGGFQLLMVDKLPTDISIQKLNLSSLRNSYPTEQTLVPGRIYVFRKNSGASNEALGIEILPERLAKLGANVTKAPHSSSDLMYLFIGGPLFMIEFEKDGHKGTIFNQAPAATTAGEQQELLILVYD